MAFLSLIYRGSYKPSSLIQPLAPLTRRRQRFFYFIWLLLYLFYHFQNYKAMEKQTLYTEQFRGKSSTYFLDLRSSEKVDYYLVLTQSQKNKEGQFENVRIRVFDDEITPFSEAVQRLVEAYRDHRQVNDPATEEAPKKQAS